MPIRIALSPRSKTVGIERVSQPVWGVFHEGKGIARRMGYPPRRMGLSASVATLFAWGKVSDLERERSNANNNEDIFRCWDVYLRRVHICAC